jgi:hypothetical protein
MTLKTNSIEIRGSTYVVSELSAKVMRESRKIIDSDKTRFELYVAAKCLVSPTLTEKELEEYPAMVSERVAAEALRLTKEDEQPVEKG